jgi:Mg-chelatase subunit ChlD
MSNSTNSNANSNSMTPDELDALLAAEEKRREEDEDGEAGFSGQSVKILRRAAQVGGGVFMRAAVGNANQAVVKRRVFSLVIALDASGSMGDDRADVVDGLNHMVSDLKTAAEADKTEVTIWLFNTNRAWLMEVGGVEINNVPLKSMPTFTLQDYQPSGTTPLYKTILVALGAASMRGVKLLNGIQGNRAAQTTYFVVISDGQNTLDHESIGNQLYTYTADEIKTLVQDLARREDTILAYLNAGDETTAEIEAKRLGFPIHQELDAATGYKGLFGFVSSSSKVVSAAPNASQAAQSVKKLGGGFVQP